MKFISDLKYNRKKAVQNKSALCKGLYILLPNMRTYANVKSYRKALQDFPFEKNNLKNIVKFLIGMLFYFYVSKDGEFKGEILYFSTILEQWNRDLKIFSIKESKVMILFANKIRASLYHKNRQRVENKFPVTEMYEFDEEKLYAIDEYIVTKNNDNVSVEIVKELFEFYLQYYSQCNAKGEFVKPDTDFCEKYDLSQNQCLKLYLAHADLSRDNYIYTKNDNRKILFIDFDHMDYYPPFYDVFFLIFNQIDFEDDYSLVEALNNGVYDKYFISFAKQNDVSIIDIYESCIKCLWHKRLFMLNEESKEKIKKVLFGIISKLKGRYLNV